MNLKKTLAIALAGVVVFANTCFAQNIVTEFEDEKSYTVDGGYCNEITVIDEAMQEEDEAIELMEYENGISIIAPATTISTAGGTLQLTAQIWEPEEEESVIWSIEQGSGYATISQTGLVTAKTNGTVVCKVRSTIDSTKIAYKTIVIAIKTEAVQQFSVTISGSGGTVTRYKDNGEVKLGSYYMMQQKAGTQFHLVAVPKSGREFAYWKDANGKIVSYEPEITFTVESAVSLTAVCPNADGTSVLVTFRDMSGKVLAEGSTSADIKVPAKPFTLGYTFYCWVNDGNMYNFTSGTVLDTTSFTKSMIFAAGYVKDSTEYTVTVTGANETGGKYLYNESVTLTHKEPEEGKRFAYWMRDGKIVSYDAEYKFYVGAFDTEVEAVFVDVNSPVAEVPIIVMSEPQVVDGNKISFVSERYLPEHLVLSSTGIILSSSSSNITLETSGILHSKAKSTDNKGQYTVRKKDVTSSETWYARAYMIYKDGDNSITVYSDPVVGKLNK